MKGSISHCCYFPLGSDESLVWENVKHLGENGNREVKCRGSYLCRHLLDERKGQTHFHRNPFEFEVSLA